MERPSSANLPWPVLRRHSRGEIYGTAERISMLSLIKSSAEFRSATSGFQQL